MKTPAQEAGAIQGGSKVSVSEMLPRPFGEEKTDRRVDPVDPALHRL